MSAFYHFPSCCFCFQLASFLILAKIWAMRVSHTQEHAANQTLAARGEGKRGGGAVVVRPFRERLCAWTVVVCTSFTDRGVADHLDDIDIDSHIANSRQTDGQTEDRLALPAFQALTYILRRVTAASCSQPSSR